MQQAKKRKTPMIVLKLDFQKAFDSVSWDALHHILIARGIGSRWVRWINDLLSSSCSRILINGTLGERIFIQKWAETRRFSITLSIHSGSRHSAATMQQRV